MTLPVSPWDLQHIHTPHVQTPWIHPSAPTFPHSLIKVVSWHRWAWTSHEIPCTQTAPTCMAPLYASQGSYLPLLPHWQPHPPSQLFNRIYLWRVGRSKHYQCGRRENAPSQVLAVPSNASTIWGNIPQPLPWTGGYPSANLLQPFTMEEVQEMHHMVDKACLWEPELNSHVETPCIERGVMSGFLFMFPFPLFVLIM